MSPAELKMQPTIQYNTNVDILNIELFYESMIALLPRILFVTTDIYEKVKNSSLSDEFLCKLGFFGPRVPKKSN
jgi:hypothetical protein